MLIIPAKDLPAVDQATIEAQGITTAKLMERAATRAFEAFPHPYDHNFIVCCGSGNNGGDGWVIARLLQLSRIPVVVYDCQIAAPSPDNQLNRERFMAMNAAKVITIRSADDFPTPPSDCIIVDALFGSGLNRPIEGYWADFVAHLNHLPHPIYAIDLPSGITADGPTHGPHILAERTFSLGTPKLSEFASQNATAYGEIVRIDIDLFLANEVARATKNRLIDAANLSSQLKQRGPFDHKGTFGHALIVAGSLGKVGAAVLASRAALRAGAGLVTAHLPRCAYEIMQISFPEAMCSLDPHRYEVTDIPEAEKYQAIGVGPGLGTSKLTYQGLTHFFTSVTRPVVVDADALNIIGRHPKLLDLLPNNSILTPHPKEFERLFGPTKNDFQRWELQRQKAKEHQIILVVKGGYTTIALPNGELVFNDSGNPGMGTAGTGDVLTGVLTGLLAQGYHPATAAQLGVYLHGLAGDLAAERTQQESLIATDVIDHLGRAFAALRNIASPSPLLS